ncbi:hypothetical protein ACYSNR_14420 [Enterococcus sp. LJL128]|uniref:hypothetical protein n=1 Tax=Enterococcus sp. LJL51 TaxID=3416656 RepID=UPI003CFBBE75
MNKNVLMAFVLPTMIFHQTTITASFSEAVISACLAEKEKVIVFDMEESGNTLIVSNERIEEEPSKEADVKQGMDSDREAVVEKKRAQQSDDEQALPNTVQENQRSGERAYFAALEHKINQLPAWLPDVEKEEGELIHMLSRMSGTVLYGTRSEEQNYREHMIF